MSDRARGTLRKRRAGEFDVEVGRLIRNLRKIKNLSQTALADAIGVTFQQVQKYEKGSNRVSLHRFVRIANALGVAADTMLGKIISGC